MPSEYHDFSIPKLPDGTEFIFSETIGGDEREKRLMDTLDAILRWLLVSCFESYESLLKDMYAQLGIVDPSSWHEKDVRKLLCGNSAAGFEDRRQALRDCSYPTLDLFNRLRRALPLLEAADTGPGYACRFTILLHGKLRHSIVHGGGRIHTGDLTSDMTERLARNLSVGEETRIRAFLAAKDGDGFSTIKLLDGMREAPHWKRYVLDTAHQGALAYWASCKKLGVSIS